MTVRLALAALLATLATGCSGNGCERLPALVAERDAARAAYAALLRSGTATAAQTEQGDTGVHRLDRQVYDLERSCS